MYKYKCSEGHPFQHTAKAFKQVQDEPLIQEFEIPCCPVCAKDRKINVDYEEQEIAAAEPIPKVPISDLIQVSNQDVTAKIKEGYQVMEDQVRAKDTILIKRGQLPPQKEYFHFQTIEALPEYADKKEVTLLWQFADFEDAAEAREFLKKHGDMVAEAKAHPDVPLVPWKGAFLTWQNFLQVGQAKEVT